MSTAPALLLSLLLHPFIYDWGKWRNAARTCNGVIHMRACMYLRTSGRRRTTATRDYVLETYNVYKPCLMARAEGSSINFFFNDGDCASRHGISQEHGPRAVVESTTRRGNCLSAARSTVACIRWEGAKSRCRAGKDSEEGEGLRLRAKR
jgi:hypothetical protein